MRILLCSLTFVYIHFHAHSLPIKNKRNQATKFKDLEKCSFEQCGQILEQINRTIQDVKDFLSPSLAEEVFGVLQRNEKITIDFLEKLQKYFLSESVKEEKRRTEMKKKKDRKKLQTSNDKTKKDYESVASSKKKMKPKIEILDGIKILPYKNMQSESVLKKVSHGTATNSQNLLKEIANSNKDDGHIEMVTRRKSLSNEAEIKKAKGNVAQDILKSKHNSVILDPEKISISKAIVGGSDKKSTIGDIDKSSEVLSPQADASIKFPTIKVLTGNMTSISSSELPDVDFADKVPVMGIDNMTPSEMDSKTPSEMDSKTPSEMDSKTPSEMDSKTPSEMDSKTPTNTGPEIMNCVDKTDVDLVEHTTPQSEDLPLTTNDFAVNNKKYFGGFFERTKAKYVWPFREIPQEGNAFSREDSSMESDESRQDISLENFGNANSDYWFYYHKENKDATNGYLDLKSGTENLVKSVNSASSNELESSSTSTIVDIDKSSEVLSPQADASIKSPSISSSELPDMDSADKVPVMGIDNMKPSEMDSKTPTNSGLKITDCDDKTDVDMVEHMTPQSEDLPLAMNDFAVNKKYFGGLFERTKAKYVWPSREIPQEGNAFSREDSSMESDESSRDISLENFGNANNDYWFDYHKENKDAPGTENLVKSVNSASSNELESSSTSTDISKLDVDSQNQMNDNSFEEELLNRVWLYKNGIHSGLRNSQDGEHNNDELQGMDPMEPITLEKKEKSIKVALPQEIKTNHLKPIQGARGTRTQIYSNQYYNYDNDFSKAYPNELHQASYFDPSYYYDYFYNDYEADKHNDMPISNQKN